MPRRSIFVALLTVFLGIAFPNTGFSNPQVVNTRPNIVFILVDDMGWTDVGCFGSKFYETPNIDRLAREGMKFTSAYAACTVCSPTRAALLTGQYPARLHLTDWIAGHDRPFAKLQIPNWTKHLPLEDRTIADLLKPEGYTSASIGKWHLGGPEYYPEHHGFDLNIGGTDRGQPPSYFSPYRIATLPDGPKGEFLSDRLTSEAIHFIEQNKDHPFFLYLPHFAVHQPIAGKPDVVQKYRAKDTAGLKQTNAVYAALVESVDDSVGRILKSVSDLGLANQTIIVFTSDNGGLSDLVNAKGWKHGPTDNSPLRLGKGSAYEGGVRVPMIVKWPGITRPGSVSDVPVISVDFLPTFLGIIGIKPASGLPLDGESLIPLLTGKGNLKRDAIYWHYPHYHPGGATPYSAMRQGDFKLIHFFEDDHVELYNLRTDIGETKNLAISDSARAKAMRSQLEVWSKSVGAQLPTPNPHYDPARVWQGDPPVKTPDQKGE